MRTRGQAGLTLIELMAAVTISGLVAVAVLFSARIGMRAWEKGQAATIELRRATNTADLFQQQVSQQVARRAVVELFDRRLEMPFFFGEERRLVFASSYSMSGQSRGGLVVADYFAEERPDGTWKLWLDERPALHAGNLAGWVTRIETIASGDLRGTQMQRARLRPFDTSRAVLLREGLRECRFRYLSNEAVGSRWMSGWSMVSGPALPSAVALEWDGRDSQRRMSPVVSMIVRLAPEGVRR